MKSGFLSKLKHPVMLAPLAGISSLPFRLINRRFGCEYAFVEMINARSLSYENKKTAELLQTVPEDAPLGVQLVGSEITYIKQAIDKLQKHPHDILDFNAACPQKKIASKGDGAALLRAPRKLQLLLKEIVGYSRKPVTVKLRLGWNSSAAAADIAAYAADSGVSALFVHGRTAAQGYSGTVDYEAIRMIKKKVAVPVIASGDILNPMLAGKMFDETGCDGILVARGALGNPWIFREITAMREGKKIPRRPTIGEIADTMEEHFRLCLDCFNEQGSVVRFRKFYVWYTRGLRGTKALRGQVMSVKTAKEMLEGIDLFRVKAGENA